MSRRHVLKIPIFVNVSPVTVLTSNIISASELDKATIQFDVSAAPSSQIPIVVEFRTHKDATWEQLQFVVAPVIDTTETSSTIIITDLMAHELRFRITNTTALSPSITLSAYGIFQTIGA